MKNITRVLLSFTFLLISYSNVFSQTQDGAINAPGDIVFIAYHDSVDGIAFLFMDDCPAGTVIKFTDSEWTGTSFSSGEGDLTWTNNTGATIVKGTIVTVQDAGGNSMSIDVGSITESDTGFGTANGDQIYAMTGSRGTPGTFLAFVGEDQSINGSETAVLTNTGLTAGVTAKLTAFEAYYNGTTDFNGTAIAAATTINGETWPGTGGYSFPSANISSVSGSVFVTPPANSTPTDITLTPSSVGQSTLGVNATVSALSSTDADGGDSHTYTLVSGTGDTDNGNFNINGTTLRSNGALTAGTHNIRINTYDQTDNFAKALTVTVLDDFAPSLNSSSPTDGATAIATSSNIVLTFNENIAFGTGNIQVIDVTNASNSFTIDAASPGSQASISGAVLTINPSSNLDDSSNYAIQIAATAIDDSNGNSFAGITNNTTLDFTTADETAPSLNSSSPTDGATAIATSSNIVLTFNENIAFGTGNIQVIDVTNASNSFTIDAASPGSQASISGAVLTINPSSNLDDSSNYAIQIAATAIDDSNGNSFAGITNNTTLDFTTADETAPSFDATPIATSITGTTLTLNADINETGDIFYVIVADGATAPTSAEVRLGQASGGATPIKSGNAGGAFSGTDHSFSVTGLTSGTAYDIYVVGADPSFNIQASPTLVNATTLDTTPPTYSTNPFPPTINATSILMGLGLSEAGHTYYVVLTDGATAPTAAEVKAGTGSGGAAEITKDNIAITNPVGGFSHTFTVGGLTGETAYDIYVISEDNAGNLQTTPFLLEITTADETNPTLNSSSPTDGATAIATDSNIVLTFDENIAFGTGNIQVIDVTNASNSFTIDAASPGSQASISGAVLTINPSTNMDDSANYAIQIAATAIDDTSGNSYVGITNNTTLDFNTVITPTITFVDLNKTFGDANFDLAATSNSAGTITYTIEGVNTTGTTLSGTSNKTVNIGNTGSLTLRATQAANGIYSSATKDITLTIAKANQTITFGALPSKILSDAPFALTGTASSGLTVTYASSNTAVATVSGSTVTIVGIGSTNITASQTGNTNYNATSNVIQALTVKSEPTLTIANATNITSSSATLHGTITSNGNTTITERGFVYGNSGNPTLVDGFSTKVVVNTSDNTYTANITGLTSPLTYYYRAYVISELGTSYSPIDDVKEEFQVLKLDQTITFGTLIDKNLGDAPFALTGTASSGLSVTYVSSNTAVATVSGNIVTVIGVGSTNITASQTGNSNYNAATNIIQALTVDNTAPTITFTNINKTYGDTNFDLAATSNSAGAITYTIEGVNTTGTTLSGTSNKTVNIGNIGNLTIRATQAANGIYGSGTKDITLTITTKAVTITADASQSKTYGATDPTFTYTLTSGTLETGDAFSGTLSRTAGENVGNYPIVVGTVSAGANYNLSFVADNFEITTKAITITVDASQSKTYGATDPTFAYTLTSGTLETGDAFTGTLSRTAGENVGNYPIAVGTVSAGANYNLSFVADNFEITTKVITITADASQSKTYGATDPTFAYTLTSGTLETGDAFTGTLSRTAGENVGNYPIAVGTVSAGANYNLSFVADNFEITTKAITITADASQSKTYGATDPTFAYTLTSGTLETGDAFSGILSRTAGENVGNYPIAVGTVSAGANYNLSFVADNFEITTKAITITADASQSKTYGATDPPFAYTLTSGTLETGDAFSGTLSRTAGENVGNYPIAVGTVSAGANYNLSFVADNFEITTKAITITADASQSKTYGATDPTFTYTLTSGTLETGDAFSGTLSRTAGENVGNYPIAVGTVSAGANYNLSFVADNFEITTKAITITADASQSKTYGATDPPFAYTLTSGTLETGDAFSGTLSRTAGENVGNYPIAVGTVSAGANYNLSFVADNFEITTKVITITADASQSKTYGATDPTFAYTLTSGTLETGDAFTGTLSRTAGENVGNYPIAVGTVSAGANYNLSFVADNFEITTKAITITADASQSKTYGATDPTFAYTLTSGTLETGDAFSGILSRTAGENVGNYPIAVGTVSAGANYNLSFVADNFEITTKAITITADASQSKTYGATDPTFAYTLTSGTLETGDAFSGTLSRTAGENVGNYPIAVGTVSAGANYNLSFVADNFEITTKAITITADASQSKTYGATDPTFTYTLTSGTLETGDAFSGTLSRTAGENVGNYPIAVGTVSAGANYNLSFVADNFEITTKAITITADASQSKTYGATDPPFAYTLTSGTLETGDAFSGTLSRTAGENVGNYPIAVGTVSAGANYNLSFVADNFEITTKEITITADASQSKIYGATDPTFAYTLTSGTLEIGDAFTGTLSRTAGENVGNYPIAVGTVSAGANYNLSFVADNFEITTKAITITADASQSKTYGATDPTFTYTLTSGTLETGDAFSGTLSRTAGENVGNYPIAVGTVSAGANYNLSFVADNFEITTKAITITADASQSKTYGATDPTFAYTLTSGTLETGDAFSGTLSRTAGENVGNYPIAVGTVSAGANYNLSFVADNFEITTKAITITADASQSKTYGATDPTFTYTLTSGTLETGDAFSGTLSRTAGENVGNYPIAVGTVSAGANYNLSFVADNFEITTKAITITADASQSKTYGATDPPFAYTLTSGTLETGDAFSGTLSRTAGENVGNYPIAVGTVSAGANYNLSFVADNFEITTKEITITADASQSKIYGATDPTFAYTLTSGTLEIGDAFTGTLSRTAGENVGNYPIAVGTVSAGANYNLSFVADNFEITTKAITITADASQSKTYGATDPTFTYTLTSGTLETGDAFSGTLSRTAGENVGNYPIAVGTVSAGANYNLSFVADNFEITTKAITITADASQSKTYGATDPTFAYTLTSGTLETGDAFSGILSRTAGENVGNYPIAVGTVSAGANYNLSFVADNFEITTKAITITADASQSKTYGATDPTFAYTLTSGTLETGDAFTGTLSRTAGENVGNYPIAVGTVSAGTNYNLSFVTDNFEITTKAITITADADQKKTYGATDPTFAYTLTSGTLETGDAFTGTLSRTAGENVGNYPIAVGTVSAGTNYNLSFVADNFEITTKAITITADADQKKTSGDVDPVFSYSITSGSLVNGDTFTGALSREVGELAGPYTLQIGTLSAGANYDLTFISNDFVISLVVTTGYINRSSKAVIIKGKVSSIIGVVERGVVYSSTNMNPEIGGADVIKVVDNTLNGPFIVTIHGLSSNTTYYFQTYIITNVAKASTPKVFFGGVKNFKTLTSEPVLISKTPVTSTLKVIPTSNLTLTFDQNIQIGNGNIIIKKVSDDSLVETIDVASGNVTINNTIVSITPNVHLPQKTALYVILPVGCFEDTNANSWSGLTTKTDWIFTTDDTTTPTVTKFSPTDNYLSVAPDNDLTITFSENMIKGTGNVLIKKESDNSVIASIDVSSSDITIMDNVVTINPSTDLPSETAMYVEIPNTAFIDLYDNIYTGFTDKTTWNFTTADITSPTVTITSTVSDPTNSTFTTTFTFSEAVTDFVIGDITLDNAIASNFTTTNSSVYTALITPTADGDVTIDVAANVATDAATNGNIAATQFSVLYDTTAPDMPAVVNIDDYTCPGTTTTTADNTLVFNGTAEADASVEVFVNSTSIGTVTTTSAGNWTFDYTSVTLADATYTVTATAKDAATNTSATSNAFIIIIDTIDTDDDGNPDFCDEDDDNDGVLDADDNSYLPNPDQADSNNNGIGDVQEDCDNDDILNYYDTDNATCQEGIIMKKKYGFSPNGDGINDTWTIENIQLYPNNVVNIYNRSGKIVFTMKGYDNSFNGFSNKTSSNKKLPVGAYYFTVEFNTPGAKPAKGWIYINY